VLIPDNTLVILNQYMLDAKIPVISGLYYSRSRPSNPLIFRGRGNGHYNDFQIGDKVWCDGVPTGCLLIHHSVLRLMWDESPEYGVRQADGRVEITRRIFETPRVSNVSAGIHNNVSGTSDLNWCDRVMREEVFERAGWAVEDKANPFLVDTNIFCKHINPNGEQFP
jgi:hypothetical protein